MFMIQAAENTIIKIIIISKNANPVPTVTLETSFDLPIEVSQNFTDESSQKPETFDTTIEYSLNTTLGEQERLSQEVILKLSIKQDPFPAEAHDFRLQIVSAPEDPGHGLGTAEIAAIVLVPSFLLIVVFSVILCAKKHLLCFKKKPGHCTRPSESFQYGPSNQPRDQLQPKLMTRANRQISVRAHLHMAKYLPTNSRRMLNENSTKFFFAGEEFLILIFFCETNFFSKILGLWTCFRKEI